MKKTTTRLILQITLVLFSLNAFSQSEKASFKPLQTFDLRTTTTERLNDFIRSHINPLSECDPYRKVQFNLKTRDSIFQIELEHSNQVTFRNPELEHPYFLGTIYNGPDDEIRKCELIMSKTFFSMRIYTFDKDGFEEMDEIYNSNPTEFSPFAIDPLKKLVYIESASALSKNNQELISKRCKEGQFYFYDKVDDVKNPNDTIPSTPNNKEDLCTKDHADEDKNENNKLEKTIYKVHSNEFGKYTLYFEVHPFTDFHNAYGNTNGATKAASRLSRVLGSDRQSSFHRHGHTFYNWSVFHATRNIVINYVNYANSPFYNFDPNRQISGSRFASEVRRIMASFNPVNAKYCRALLMEDNYSNLGSKSTDGQAGSLGSYKYNSAAANKYFYSKSGFGTNREWLDCHEAGHCIGGRHPKGNAGWNDNVNQDAEYGYWCSHTDCFFNHGHICYNRPHYGTMSYAAMTNHWMKWNAKTAVRMHINNNFGDSPEATTVVIDNPTHSRNTVIATNHSNSTGEKLVLPGAPTYLGKSKVYKIKIKKKGGYRFFINTGNFDTYMYLCKKNIHGKAVKMRQNNNDNNRYIIISTPYGAYPMKIHTYLSGFPSIFLNTGTYYLVVSGAGAQTGTYSLSYKYNKSQTSMVKSIDPLTDQANHNVQNLESSPSAETENQGLFETEYGVCEPSNEDESILKIVKTSEKILEEDMASLKVYPNPTKGLVTFELSGTNSSNMSKIKIVDVHGKLIKSLTIENENQSVVWDTETTEPGTYFYSIKKDDETIVNGQLIIID